MSTGAEQSKRNRSWLWRTVVRRADLYGRSAGALASRRWPCRDADVVDGVGREVVEPVRVDRRRDGDADVLAQVRVVVVELVRVDRESGAAVSLSGLVPRQLDRRRRRRLALQVRRLLRHYSTAIAASTTCPSQTFYADCMNASTMATVHLAFGLSNFASEFWCCCRETGIWYLVCRNLFSPDRFFLRRHGPKLRSTYPSRPIFRLLNFSLLLFYWLLCANYFQLNKL